MIEKQRVVRKKKVSGQIMLGKKKTIILREFHSSVAKRLVMCSES